MSDGTERHRHDGVDGIEYSIYKLLDLIGKLRGQIYCLGFLLPNLHLHYYSETFCPGNCLEGISFVVA